MTDDYLIIKSGNKAGNFNISYGYIDRIFGAFDFKMNRPKNITGYRLKLSIEDMSPESLRLLEEFIAAREQYHDVMLSLDGIISKGRAKIAQILSYDGYNFDVELSN